MTGTRDIEKEWMSSAQTKKVIPVANPQIGVTYGDFAQGTARRVYVPRTIHFMESHDRGGIGEMIEWMRKALRPSDKLWIDAKDQTWAIKEWATLVAMLACFASLMPLGRIFLGMKFFNPIQGAPTGKYACSIRSYLKFSGINGLLMWLYLPLIFVLFGVHVYVVPIDGIFPMMMVNGVVWWFFWINVIGFFIFRRWFRRESQKTGLTWAEVGVSYRQEGFGLDGGKIAKTILLALILFGFAYFSEHLLEQIFIVDFRFLFPFASDLTVERAWICLRYFPFILVGFVFMGVFLHGQLRRPAKDSRLATWISWSFWNLVAMVTPVILFLMIQYVPLFSNRLHPPGRSGRHVCLLCAQSLSHHRCSDRRRPSVHLVLSSYRENLPGRLAQRPDRDLDVCLLPGGGAYPCVKPVVLSTLLTTRRERHKMTIVS